MEHFGIHTLLLIGLYYFSEGKPCPEKTRPHKTRCDAFFKCQDLSTKSHVWIPSVCEKGLVYEHNLRLCVLPEDDWECILEEGGGTTQTEYQNVALSHSSNVTAVATNVPVDAKARMEPDLEIVDDDRPNALSAFEVNESDANNFKLTTNSSAISEDGDSMNADEYESSGNGEVLASMSGGPLRTESKGSNDYFTENDGFVTEGTSSRIDPKLIAHLQRLSQLIDGLKQTYQNQDKEQTELRPDQLNAFLAHFNIKNKFNNLNPIGEKSPLRANNEPSKGAQKGPLLSSDLQVPSSNKTELGAKLRNSIKPETKVLLASDWPKRHNSAGYSSSHTVMNRPDGSVIFKIGRPQSDEHYFSENQYVLESHQSPKISEETLKTVLELSQQMITTENVPRIIPHAALYSQRVRPFYLSTDIFSGSKTPFSGYDNNENKNSDGYNMAQHDDEGHFSSSVISTNHKKHAQRQSSNIYSRPSTTIIHNNLIPVHVATTNSGEKEVLDSYGQSLGRYPPLDVDSSFNGLGQHRPHHHTSDHYADDTIYTSFQGSTRRPLTATSPANHLPNQYPSPYANEVSVTTMQPFDYQVASTTVADFFTPSPHLNEHNVHHLYHASDRFPTVQYTNIPRPVDGIHPSTHQNQPVLQIDLPNQQKQQHYFSHDSMSSPLSQGVLNNFRKRPNEHTAESMEENGSDETSNYHNQAFSSNQPSAYLSNAFSNQYSSPFNPGSSNQFHYTSHNFMPRPPSASSSSFANNPISSASSYNNNNSKLKYPLKDISSGSATEGLLVHFAGNFIRYDVFQKTILPLFLNSPNAELNNIEIITCAAGVRQPNATDCTRYYVCSKTNGKVLSYSCPPFTAFNPQTRICDARTYSACTAEMPASSYSDKRHKHGQSLGLYQALQDAKRKQEEALKTQSVSHLIQPYDLQVNPPASSESAGSSQEKDVLNTYAQQAASMAAAVSTAPKPAKKRKYYCKEGDKIADQTSKYSYFVCYKNAQGHMKGHKMTCSKGLLFCSKTTMCTLPSKC